MYKNRNRISMIIPAIAIVIGIFAIVIFGSSLLSRKPSPTDVSDAGEEALVNIDAGSGIRMTLRGKINAEEVHGSYQITIRPDSRVMRVYQGYLDKVIAEKAVDNNYEAYTEFSYAVQRSGMMDGRELTESEGDVRGICPAGKLTRFEVLQDDRTIKTLWHTSCSKDKESFEGKYKPIEKLFLAQITEYKTLLKGTKF
ncbi:MAG: hypothetical protein LBK50_03360 [Candidatus Nomurabacteria bacterium]|jgi:hypothetical protein|nr:hypothetical protein [Candidatus Nomurabacteria bacterium]